jgi:hypothetical protein
MASSPPPFINSTEWNDSVAPPGNSFWEAVARIGTPNWGYLQNQAYGTSGINNVTFLSCATTRRLYVSTIQASVDALATCQFTILPWNNAYPSGPSYGNIVAYQSQPSLATMPQSLFMPFTLSPGMPFKLEFDGELWLDPGTALAFSCHGLPPNPNPNSLATPSPNANVFGYGFEIDIDAY